MTLEEYKLKCLERLQDKDNKLNAADGIILGAWTLFVHLADLKDKRDKIKRELNI